MSKPAAVGAAVVLAASGLLIALALGFDFFCDDAFIVLRYAENFARHGAPVYNLGERVEGYTSFTWLLLATAGSLAGLPLPSFMQWVGAASGVAMLAATWAVWRRLHADRPWFGAVVLVALALSAPVAAWTMSGLETPLFTALVTAAFALAIDLTREPSARRAASLGLLLGVATLTRPEGALVAGVVGLVIACLHGRGRAQRRALAGVALCFILVVGAHLVWRVGYYGYPLPNTFYVKASGDTGLLRLRGLRYVLLAGRELGALLVVAISLGLLGAGRAAADRSSDGRRLLCWIGRLLIPSYVLYVIAVGGDFLDLYRFFVPILPLGLLLAGCALAERAGSVARPVAIAAAIASLGWHGVHQHALAQRAKQVVEPARAKHGIEPLGWTRLYALRWAALGRWIALHARPGDGMAVGAAGAMPYYAGIANLDTFGLCDAWVAHHAPIVGNRPGHQRFAPDSYILSKRPAFLLIGNDYSSDQPRPLRRGGRWVERGYVWAEARIDADRFGAPRDFYHYLLIRRDRAEQAAGSAFLRIAL
jgi:arabinofuranosyltransferase